MKESPPPKHSNNRTKILYPYNFNVRNIDQYQTRNFVSSIKKYFNIAYYPCKLDTDYDKGFNYMLSLNETFLIIEQDIVPTYEQLIEMIECKEPICVANYKLYPTSTALKTPVLAHRNNMKFISPSDTTAELYGLGLVKFSKSVLPLLKDHESGTWNTLDTRISQLTNSKGYKAHIHSEVPHNHKGGYKNVQRQ